jgi:hypothetical protein
VALVFELYGDPSHGRQQGQRAAHLHGDGQHQRQGVVRPWRQERRFDY